MSKEDRCDTAADGNGTVGDTMEDGNGTSVAVTNNDNVAVGTSKILYVINRCSNV